MATDQRVLVVYERPVCNHETPKRCHRTATVMVDGVYLCPDHVDDSIAKRFPNMVRPIRYERGGPP